MANARSLIPISATIRMEIAWFQRPAEPQPYLDLLEEADAPPYAAASSPPAANMGTANV